MDFLSSNFLLQCYLNVFLFLFNCIQLYKNHSVDLGTVYPKPARSHSPPSPKVCLLSWHKVLSLLWRRRRLAKSGNFGVQLDGAFGSFFFSCFVLFLAVFVCFFIVIFGLESHLSRLVVLFFCKEGWASLLGSMRFGL